MRFRARKSQLLLAALAALVAALSAAEIWRDSQNSLRFYPEWRSAKAELGMGVNGAVSFLVHPVALAGRSLNLAAWHGQQELQLQRSWPELPPLRLRLRGGSSSAFYLIARPSGGGEGFAWRLANHPGQSSAWIALSEEREFLRKRTFSYSLPKDEWVEVGWGPSEAGLSLWVNGQLIDAVPWPSGSWKISLRGQAAGGSLLVSDIQIGDYRQNFTGSFPWGLFSAAFLILWALLLLLRLHPASLLAVPALAALAFLAYRYGLAPRYPSRLDLQGYKSTIETSPEALARLRALPVEERKVVLWLGGSQAWGAGASDPAHSAFGRLAGGIGPRFQLVNGAISGAQVKDQLKAFHAVAERRRIAAVILICGVNDALNPAFTTELKSFTEQVAKAGAKVMLVAEPVELPASSAVMQRQRELLDFARAGGHAFFDLPLALGSREDTGLLWWDFVHFTNFGARLVAELLVPPVSHFLRNL